MAKPSKLTVTYNEGATATVGSSRRPPTSDFYWKEAKIHQFGNTGLLGRLHALVAPLVTNLIDSTSYGGRHIRREVHAQLQGAGSVLDLCCGVGMSTPPNAVGVDASQEMIDAARFYHPSSTFRVGNAETYGESFYKRRPRQRSPCFCRSLAVRVKGQRPPRTRTVQPISSPAGLACPHSLPRRPTT
jgi:SAM-dependent methyltransferase